MFAVFTVLIRPLDAAPPPLPPDPVLADIVWQAATPDDALQHVRVRGDGTSVRVVLFLRQDSREAALARARAVCERAAVRSAPLHGCRIVECRPL